MSKIAIYPGTFDPITHGHSDIVHRATQLFDRVIIAVSENTHKNPAFDFDERITLAAEVLTDNSRAEVKGFSNLLVDFAREHGANTIIRGLRAVSDLEYEFQLASMNRKLSPNIETIFLMPDEQYTYLSSSIVRQVAALKGDISDFVHPVVFAALAGKHS
ncbi:MAG: pantetheine-phosphate adenylyltransferase [Gammaproteobacteria bacterium]|nr:pantetheine-phosphate adenylyltransferase [Gammaproteobacteria bacterium]